MSKKIIVIILTLVVLAGAAIYFYNSKNGLNVFSTLKSQKFSSDLSLEDGYKIIEPYAKKWNADAELSQYYTNIPTDKEKFKVNVYTFDSLSQSKNLAISYNFKLVEDSSLGDPKQHNEINQFLAAETNWINIAGFKKLSGQELIDAKKYYIPFDNLSQFLTSDQIIALAKKEGLNDFLNKYSGLDVKQNQVQFMNLTNEPVWVVVYFVGELNVIKPTHSFMIKFDPKTGDIISKVIK